MCKEEIAREEQLTLNILHQNISQDIEKFLLADNLFSGNEFIKSAFATCIFDWEWSNALGWPQGQWLIGRCHENLLIGTETDGNSEFKARVRACAFYQKAAQ